MSLWHRSAHTSKLHQVLAEKPSPKKQWVLRSAVWMEHVPCSSVHRVSHRSWKSENSSLVVWWASTMTATSPTTAAKHVKSSSLQKTLALSQPQKNALIKYVYYIVLLCFQWHTKPLHCVCPTGSTFFCPWCPNLLLEIKMPEITKTVGHFCWWKTKWQLRKYVSLSQLSQ